MYAHLNCWVHLLVKGQKAQQARTWLRRSLMHKRIAYIASVSDYYPLSILRLSLLFILCPVLLLSSRLQHVLHVDL